MYKTVYIHLAVGFLFFAVTVFIFQATSSYFQLYDFIFAVCDFMFYLYSWLLETRLSKFVLVDVVREDFYLGTGESWTHYRVLLLRIQSLNLSVPFERESTTNHLSFIAISDYGAIRTRPIPNMCLKETMNLMFFGGGLNLPWLKSKGSWVILSIENKFTKLSP